MNYQPRLSGNAKRNVLGVALGIVFGVLIGATSTQAAQPAQGGSCTSGQVTGPINNSVASDANNLRCVSSAWAYPIYQLGATSTACNSSTAGALQWTTTSFKGCDGSNWNAFITGGTALSAITAATGSNTIANGANAQTWNWDTITTGNALTLSSTSVTSGSLLTVQATNVTNGGGGAGVIYASTASNGSNSGAAVVGRATATTASGSTYGGDFSSAGNYGSGIIAVASHATGQNYGGSFQTASSAGTAIAASAYTTTGTTYGVYSTAASGSGYGGYFNNSGGGYGLYATASGSGTGASIENSGTGRALRAYTPVSNNTYTAEIIQDYGSGVALYVRTTSTSGSGTTALISNSAANGTGVNASGGSMGIRGAATSNSGYGVYGTASGSSSYAGAFISGNAGSIGLYATATGSGTAIWGNVNGASGYAGYFYAADNGTGAYAYSRNGTALYVTSSASYGIDASANGAGAAVRGTASASTGGTFGGQFSSSSSTGTGVQGQATGGGTNYGVYGTSSSSTGYGGFFENFSTGWGLFSNDDVGIYANGYLNFGTSHGTGGYGLRDSSGTMQYKNSGGSWTSFGAASASPSGTICGNRFTQCSSGTPSYDSNSSPATCGGNTLTATCSGSVVSAVSGCPAGYAGKWTLNAIVSAFVYTTIYCVAN